MEKLKLEETVTETEEEIANFLLEQGSNIEKYPSCSLAEATYTSPTTIARVCERIGFGGFEDFKTQCVKEIRYLDQQPGEVDVNFLFSEKDTIMKAANRIALLYGETAQNTVSLLRHDALQRAVKLLHYSQNVYVFSAGTIINQVECFREKMTRIEKRVAISNNLDYQLYETDCLSVRDVAVTISYSGETGKTLRVAMECKKRLVPVTILTSSGEDSLTRYAVCELTVSTKESPFQNLGDFSTHLSVSLLLDILYAAYFQQDYSGDYQRKLERTSLLERFRKSTSSTIIGGEGRG